MAMNITNKIQNGKGSKRRDYNYKRYANNYDEINWHHNEDHKDKFDSIKPRKRNTVRQKKY